MKLLAATALSLFSLASAFSHSSETGDASSRGAARSALAQDSQPKAIYLATMLSFHAGRRDKEIRTLQWKGISAEQQSIP
jgi:hypothetical protein